MSKKVQYHDSEGFSQVGELQEFEIDKFYSDDKPDSKGRRGYGFARPVGRPRGTSRGIFMHASNRFYYMRAYGIRKLEYLPEFTNQLTFRDNETEIEPGARVRIIGVVGEGHKGQELLAWSTNTGAYDKALEQCKLYHEHEIERLERNPQFRCLETSRVPVGHEFPRKNPVFEGTKKQFEERFPLGAFSEMSNPDSLLSQKIGDVEYIRWFERELSGEDEWERCNDPRRMRLQLTQTAAYRLLQFDSIRRADDPVSWFSLDHPEKLVARGNYRQGNQRVVQFPATSDYLETEFSGDQAEILWKLGEFMAQVQEADAEATRRPLGK